MPWSREDTDVSELERELEAAFEEEPTDAEVEPDFDLETDEDSELLSEIDEAHETGGDVDVDSFAERLYELSTRLYESETQIEQEVDGILNDIEREYFLNFKRLKNQLKAAGKKYLQKGLKMAAGKIPALKVVQALTRIQGGGLKGLLKAVATAGLSALPGGAMAAPALKALGFEAGAPDGNRQAWERFVGMAREAYEYMAENTDEESSSPFRGGQLAASAFQAALRRAQSRKHITAGDQRTRVIHVKSGQRIIIQAD